MNKKFNLINLENYLSHDVNYLVESGQVLDHELALDTDNIWLDQKDCVLNADFVALNGLAYKSDGSINFLESILNIKKYFKSVKANLKSCFNSFKHSNTFFQEDVAYFHQNVIINLDNSNDVGLQLALSNIFTLFERRLGDVLYTLNNFNAAKVPFLLKDLVNDSKLESLFGKPLLDLIKLFVYTPYSLNLRNLCWHGFMQPFQINEHYIYFFVSLISTLNSKLKFKLEEDKSLRARPKFNLNNLRVKNSNNFELFKQFPQTHSNECSFIINNCKLIDSSRRDIWLRIYGNDLSDNFTKLVLILPQLEHMLRKLYSLANHDSECEGDSSQEINSMCQVAKMNEFYLTMDDLLNYYYTNNRPNDKINKKRNKLAEFLDDGLIFLLYEIFMYVDGPRIRDHVSHGDLNQVDIPDYYVEIIQFLGIQLASILMPKSNELDSLFEFKSLIYDRYEPSYHPICCFQSEIYNLIEKEQKLPEYEEIAKLSNEEKEQQPKDFTELKSKLENMVRSRFGLDLDESFLISKVKSKWKINDFFRFVFRYEIEAEEYDSKAFKSSESQLVKSLVSILKQIDLFMASISEKIDFFTQLNRTHLRERQRNNISYFCSTYQSLKVFLDLSKYFFILFADFYIFSIETKAIEGFYFNENSKINFSQINKHLKQYLQIVQNLSSRVMTNKWLECQELIFNNEKFCFVSLVEMFLDN